MNIDNNWSDFITEQYEEVFKEDVVVAEGEIIEDFIHISLGGGFESCQD